jgi:hypothetical protein
MRKACLLLMLISFGLRGYAQKDVDNRTGWSPKERMYLGLGFGGLGFGQDSRFGTYYSIGLTPMVGYMLAKDLSAGLAFEYLYQGFPDAKTNYTRYGGYPFLRYNIKNFFIQTDYDLYSVEDFAPPIDGKREMIDRFMVGIGYFSRGGGRSAVNFLVSYDFIYSNPSPFSSPVSIRIFITF